MHSTVAIGSGFTSHNSHYTYISVIPRSEIRLPITTDIVSINTCLTSFCDASAGPIDCFGARRHYLVLVFAVLVVFVVPPEAETVPSDVTVPFVRSPSGAVTS